MNKSASIKYFSAQLMRKITLICAQTKSNMRIIQSLTLLSCFLCIGLTSFSQRYDKVFPRKYDDVRWSTKEEGYDFLMDRSRKLKTDAIVALATGPLLTGIGVHLLSKESSTVLVGSGNWIGVRENDSPNRVYGTILAGVGGLTSLTIVPLFIKSAKAKRKANLLVSDQSTSFLNSKIFVPSLGLQIGL
jgi:hypothetical protein